MRLQFIKRLPSKPIRLSRAAAATLVGVLLFVLPARPQFSYYPNLDLSTQRDLEQLNRLILTGQSGQAKERLQEIINNSGYIKPLAQIFYRMAQNDPSAAGVARHYGSIIENWPQSAWAQKAAIDLIPLLIMSDGRLGIELETAIWEHSVDLLEISDDAGLLGENAETLQRETHHQLMNLAYFRFDANLIRRLTERLPSGTPHQDSAELMVAETYVREEQWQQARQQLNHWMQAHPNSNFQPYALQLLIQTAHSPSERQEYQQRLRSQHPNSLEAQMLQ